MSIADLNWEGFFVICAAIGLLRSLFHRVLPLRLISTTTAATAGFVVFLGIPILGYSDSLTISVFEYGLFVCVAYLSFLVGASLARLWFGAGHPAVVQRQPSRRLARIATIYCTLWVGFSFLQFLVTGGPAKVMVILFGNVAHQAVLAQIAERARLIQGQSVLDIFLIVLGNIFICFWVIMFIKTPKRALVLYALFIVSQLDVYFSRSGLLGRLMIPMLAYLTYYRPTNRWLVVQATAGIVLVLVFFSWNSATRLGRTYAISFDKVLTDTLRDAGNSAVPATTILSTDMHGDVGNYFLSIAGFLLPRSIWEGKPAEQFNYEITYRLTGLEIGKGTSVITSTMLGEAWYYFGWSGAIWLMLMFGFFAFLFERLLRSHMLFTGMFFSLVFQSFVQVRSTFLTYYQTGVLYLLSGFLLMVILSGLSTRWHSNESQDSKRNDIAVVGYGETINDRV